MIWVLVLTRSRKSFIFLIARQNAGSSYAEFFKTIIYSPHHKPTGESSRGRVGKGRGKEVGNSGEHHHTRLRNKPISYVPDGKSRDRVGAERGRRMPKGKGNSSPGVWQEVRVRTQNIPDHVEVDEQLWRSPKRTILCSAECMKKTTAGVTPTSALLRKVPLRLRHSTT